MRQYLSEPNLLKASALGGVITLMAAPRIVLGDMKPAFYIPAAFIGITLISGAATAWGRLGGMQGVWPGRKDLGRHLGIAALLALALGLVSLLLLDPVFQQAIARSGNRRFMEMQYPSSAAGCLALVLWSSGFEAVFFYAAAPAFIVRLTGRIWTAYVFVAFLRLYVTFQQMGAAGITDAEHLFVAGSVVVSFVSCLLFVRAGLPAVMIFAAVLNLRMLLHL